MLLRIESMAHFQHAPALSDAAATDIDYFKQAGSHKRLKDFYSQPNIEYLRGMKNAEQQFTFSANNYRACQMFSHSSLTKNSRSGDCKQFFGARKPL